MSGRTAAVVGHFARAAEKCYVSQPALSAAIAKLERELNVTLINRGHSFEGLTPEGERLVVWAKRILAESAFLVTVETDLERAVELAVAVLAGKGAQRG